MPVAEESGTSADDDYEQFRRDMVRLVPSLRAFARGLCRNPDTADDLVQEAMLKAWSSRHTFTPGTNFRAWMYRILRNHYYTAARKARRETALDPEVAERTLVQAATQEHALHLEDVDAAMARLPAHQAEILWLIAGAGMSYEDAAEVMGVGIGTVKSRLNRARIAVKALVEGEAEAVSLAPAAAPTIQITA